MRCLSRKWGNEIFFLLATMEIAILSLHLRGRGKCLPLRGRPFVTAQQWRQLPRKPGLGAPTPSEAMASPGCGAEDESGCGVGEWVISPWHLMTNTLQSMLKAATFIGPYTGSRR